MPLSFFLFVSITKTQMQEVWFIIRLISISWSALVTSGCVNWSWILIQVHKVVFMVRSLNIEYFKPALLDDLLHVTVQATELGRTRITLSQHVLRDHVTLASATARVVCVGADTRKLVSLPAPLRHKFGNFS